MHRSVLARAVHRWHRALGLPRRSRAWHRDDVIREIVEFREVDALLKPTSRHDARASDSRQGVVTTRASTWRDRLAWLSEYSDVLYTLTRAEYAGHEFKLPASMRQVLRKDDESTGCLPYVAVVYMLGKYTLRWQFYRVAANGQADVREVRNPRKDANMVEMAETYGMDEGVFLARCRRLRRVWPFLP